MKSLLIFLTIFVCSALALTRSDRSITPKKNKYESDEDYSDTENESTLPQTSFKCDGRRDGFYADIENGCKSFHYCQTFVFPDDDPHTQDWVFLCPPTLIFRQEYLTCTNPSKKFRCEDSEQHFDVNEDLPPIEPGEEPTLPPPESDTSEPPVEEETTQPPTTTTTTTKKPPKPKPTTTQKPPRPKPTTTPKPPKPKPTMTTPLPTEEPITEETETEAPDSSEIIEDPEDSKKKMPQNGFLLPPFSTSNFGVSPLISLIPNLHSSSLVNLKHVDSKYSGKDKVVEKAGSKNKIDLKNPLTLDQYLQKTSWESLDKTKGADKWAGISNLLKAPLIFPSTILPQTPTFPSLPLFRVVNEQIPALLDPNAFDQILFRYNAEPISDNNEAIGPR